MNGKVLITGATGLLGLDLMKVLKRDYRTMGVSTENFDIRDYPAVESFFERMRPDIVLHAAAWADVDGCEEEKEDAYAINATGAGNVARACKNAGARLIYYSTDYVFDGEQESLYDENAKENPINIYGQSKYEGEKRVLDILENTAVMRISWLYGTGKSCFVSGIIKAGLEQIRARQSNKPYEVIKVVSDQYSCPTWTVDVADQTKKLMESDVTGIVHSVSEGFTSRFKLAEHIFEELSWDVELRRCRMADFPMKAPRPKQSALENRRLGELGISVMRDYREAMRDFLMVHKEE